MDKYKALKIYIAIHLGVIVVMQIPHVLAGIVWRTMGANPLLRFFEKLRGYTFDIQEFAIDHLWAIPAGFVLLLTDLIILKLSKNNDKEE